MNTSLPSRAPEEFALHPELRLSLDGHVATLEMCRPPHNFFTESLIGGIVDALEHLDGVPQCRAVVLAANGKSFCAGADFSDAAMSAPGTAQRLYARAIGIFRTHKPIVAAVQGAAIGGGLGLALAADFRVVGPDSRLSANFCRLGFHPGFGLSVTLPRLIGVQKSAWLFYSGRRVGGEEALDLGLADALIQDGGVRERAQSLAADIAANAPLAVMSVRKTLRQGLAEAVEQATVREASEQEWQWKTRDFKEGVAAAAERRTPLFEGC